ncbi:hypothetical protein BKA62DRAFT_689303 [Auriculariales sp. MPI-PUGE-AT-0066]|nr:hypothetical protein BKA62DRAFT_689303 [Auriculariales sp. MPI-PUGE-AT-0066]
MQSYISLAVLLAAVSPSLAGLDKDTLFKNGLSDPLADFYSSIPKPPSSVQDMPPPQICIDRAGDHCSADKIQAVSVKYNDCDVPWTLCRCDDANMSMDTMVDRFGSLPPGVRSYVGAALAVQADNPSAGSSGDFITFNGECGVSVFLHEAGHSLDQGTSPSQEWTDALGQSSCVPDDYANSSPAEDFAQVEVVYYYQLKKGSLPADPGCLQPQLNYMNATERVRDANMRDSCSPEKRPFTFDPPAAPQDPTTSDPVPVPTETPTTPEDPSPAPEDPVPTPTPSSCPAGKVRRSEKLRRRAARRA